MTNHIDGPIYHAMRSGTFPVLVSLARHDMDLARAAVDAGVFGIKFHLNAFHRASGTTFGSFKQERPFIEQLARLGKPMLVMSGQETQPTSAELDLLAELGVEGFNVYRKHAQPHLFKSRLRPILALDEESTEADLKAIAAIPGAMLEASVTPFSDYGAPFNEDDLARYAEIVRQSGLPVIAPSQKRFVPDDMEGLRRAGVGAVLVGSIVTGNTPQSLAEALQPLVAAAQRYHLPSGRLT